jgi:hypothetical protein
MSVLSEIHLENLSSSSSRTKSLLRRADSRWLCAFRATRVQKHRTIPMSSQSSCSATRWMYRLSKMAKFKFAQSTGGPPVGDLEQSFRVDPSRKIVSRPIRSMDICTREPFLCGFDTQSRRETLVNSLQYILKTMARCSNSLFESATFDVAHESVILQARQQRGISTQKLVDSRIKWTIALGSSSVSKISHSTYPTYLSPIVEKSVTE